MAKVEKYILELLHQHDCVVIPGLGGLVTNYKPASLSGDYSTLLPPMKEVGFNRSLSHHDGMLAGYIARREGLNYKAAVAIVNTFVKDIEKEILAGRVLTLGSIGSFRADAIGNLQFSPARDSFFLPSSFGLCEFNYDLLEISQQLSIAGSRHVGPRQLKPRSPVYWAGVAALVTGVFLISTLEVKMPGVSHATFQPLTINAPFNRPDTTMVQSSLTAPDYSRIEGHQRQEPELIVDQPPPFNSGKFNLVAASFEQLSPAEKFTAELKALGYSDTRIIKSGEGRYRVAVLSFHDRNEALSSLNELKMEKRFSGVWLLVTK